MDKRLDGTLVKINEKSLHGSAVGIVNVLDFFEMFLSYGGNKPQSTRVLWPNGSVDPWNYLSVLSPANDQQECMMVN